MMACADHPKGIRLTIDSLLDDVFLVGLAMRAYAEHLGFDDSEAASLELAVVEAVNNAIIHGCNGKLGHKVNVSVTIRPHWLIAAVSCTGSGKVRFPPPENPVSAESEIPECGRGLLLIHQIMDEVLFETLKDRHVLTMKKRLPDRP